MIVSFDCGPIFVLNSGSKCGTRHTHGTWPFDTLRSVKNYVIAIRLQRGCQRRNWRSFKLEKMKWLKIPLTWNVSIAVKKSQPLWNLLSWQYYGHWPKAGYHGSRQHHLALIRQSSKYTCDNKITLHTFFNLFKKNSKWNTTNENFCVPLTPHTTHVQSAILYTHYGGGYICVDCFST